MAAYNVLLFSVFLTFKQGDTMICHSGLHGHFISLSVVFSVTVLGSRTSFYPHFPFYY